MAEDSGEGRPDWWPLLNAPTEVIRRLKNEPLLLVGIGTAVVLAVIAVYAPDRGRFYALLLTGLVLILCLIRAFTIGTRRKDTPPPTTESDIRLGGRSQVEDVHINTWGPSARTRFRSRRGSKIKGARFNTGMRNHPDEAPPPGDR
ncbi:hypothetical protein GCM10023196_035000 [Actinoallomurus vinaceus]|uniref:Uncharacterized protein n=1 Tax=Actinoallomurus vinaceus TaxID=1080074 RepID=A0ABP8UBF7_9ACTN